MECFSLYTVSVQKEVKGMHKKLPLITTLLLVIGAFAFILSQKQNKPSDFRDAVREEFQNFDTSISETIFSARNSQVKETAHEILRPPWKIIDGLDAVPGEFPFIAIIRSQTWDKLFSCGGSLIKKNWVLTAAHCTRNAMVGSITIGAYDRKQLSHTEGLEVFYPTKSIHHPNYDEKNHDYDFSLIRLDGESKFDPIPLNREELGANISLVLAGWGRTEKDGHTASHILQKTSVPLVSADDCRKTWPNITDNMLCGGYENSPAGAYFGDSGGPVLVGAGADRKLVGVVSSGKFGKYNKYGKVSAVVSWIDSMAQ